ncbi:MAG TPA: hypothetical protein VLT92_11860, partial [Burkholderiales bacterium]|nr:hypothetical protein [Burkholderiales bacterium]
SARAAQGDWLGRVRAIHISPDASSSALNLDFSYFVTNNLALELILATKGHNVTAGVRLWAASSCCRRH